MVLLMILVADSIKAQSIPTQYASIIYTIDTSTDYPYKHWDVGYVPRSYAIFNTSLANTLRQILTFCSNVFDSSSAGYNIGNSDLTISSTTRNLDFNGNTLQYTHLGAFEIYGATGNPLLIIDDNQFIVSNVSAIQINSNSTGKTNIPILLSYADSLNKSSPINPLTSFHVTKTGTYSVQGHYKKLVYVPSVYDSVILSWTDENNVAQLHTLLQDTLIGYFSFYFNFDAHISSSIVVYTNFASAGTGYNCVAEIKQEE